jgi:hypothetical protein
MNLFLILFLAITRSSSQLLPQCSPQSLAGSTDRNVHPYYQRRMHRVLAGLEGMIEAIEVPNMGHWW